MFWQATIPRHFSTLQFFIWNSIAHLSDNSKCVAFHDRESVGIPFRTITPPPLKSTEHWSALRCSGNVKPIVSLLVPSLHLRWPLWSGPCRRWRRQWWWGAQSTGSHPALQLRTCTHTHTHTEVEIREHCVIPARRQIWFVADLFMVVSLSHCSMAGHALFGTPKPGKINSEMLFVTVILQTALIKVSHKHTLINQGE